MSNTADLESLRHPAIMPRENSTFHPLRTSQTGLIPSAMRLPTLILGLAALLIGLLWVGQGAGLIYWPASSFMIDQRPWVTRGATLAVVGLILIAVSRVRR
jgi:hypothetical protein